MTPNILARTIETVEGGGLVVMLLNTLSSLTTLCTMVMVWSITIFSYLTNIYCYFLGSPNFLNFLTHVFTTLMWVPCDSYFRTFMSVTGQRHMLRLFLVLMKDSYYLLHHAKHAWSWMMNSIFCLCLLVWGH